MADAPEARPHGPRVGAAVLGFIGGAIIVAILGGVIGSRLNLFAAAPTAAPILDTRPASAFSAVELRGRTIYYANCAVCHGGPTGGGMMDYPPRHNSNP